MKYGNLSYAYMELWDVIHTLQGEVGNLEALVLALGSRNNGSVADQGIVDTGIRN